jgi:hypothetical protein
MAAALFAAGGAQGQLIEPVPERQPPLRMPARASLPSLPSFYAGSQGLAPADPLALDLYRADPKLYAGVDFGAGSSIETRFTPPDYREGLHYIAYGPRLANGIPLGEQGFDLDLVARQSVPVGERLGVFGELGLSATRRQHHEVGTTAIGPAASVGATYKLNSKQTATLEAPLGGTALKTLGGYGANLKLGF